MPPSLLFLAEDDDEDKVDVNAAAERPWPLRLMLLQLLRMLLPDRLTPLLLVFVPGRRELAETEAETEADAA